MKKTCITADDFGLTCENTRTIITSVDQGCVSRVSVIPNGYAVDEALAAWEKRKNTLELSVHLNLTEGKALSAPSDIPHLADRDGNFRHSSLKLLCLSLVGGTRLQDEIQRELSLQVARVRTLTGSEPVFVDGHQHIHMVPMVFDAILTLHAKRPFAGVRVIREPFYIPTDAFFAYFGLGSVRHFGLNVLARRAQKAARNAGLSFPAHFVGALISGRQTHGAIESALLESKRLGGESVEINLHPGSANEGELAAWSGDVAWHYSIWRRKERELAMTSSLAALISAYEGGTLPTTGTRILEVMRFLVAGSIATGTNLGLLYIFTELAGIWYLVSALLSYSIATIVSFGLQKFWAFTHRSTEHARREFALYVANNVLGVACNLVGLHLLVEYAQMWYMLAQFILLAIIAAWNFLVFRFVIFRIAKS
jgi:predicted glycoside hydrolase/deacetylase ChbG (UPF0249 family)/putative flippase GtrA